MNKFELFCSVFCFMYLPIMLTIVVLRLSELKAVNFDFAEITKSDFINLFSAFAIPLNAVLFALNHTDLVLLTLWPTLIGYVALIAPCLVLDCVNKKYFMIYCGGVKANLMLLSYLVVIQTIAFVNASHNEYIINVWQMSVIALFLIIFWILAFAFVPFMREMKERQLGKTLGGERQRIFRKEELALKKMPNVKLHDLLLKYRSLSDKDYEDYAKYSTNENYTYPLIKGAELIDFHLRIICKELNHRNYLNEYWY